MIKLRLNLGLNSVFVRLFLSSTVGLIIILPDFQVFIL